MKRRDFIKTGVGGLAGINTLIPPPGNSPSPLKTASPGRKKPSVLVKVLGMAQDGGIPAALEAILVETKRVADHGFTSGELERAKADQLRSDLGIALLANLVTLTPGTLAIGLTGDRSEMLVHAMFAADDDELRREIKDGYERRIMELLS